MKLRTTILALAAVALAGAAQAQQQDFSKVEVKAAKVAGQVWMLTGAGGNIGAIVGDDGIVIVDDQFLPLADKIRAALKGVTDKPLRFVINTHYHFDHAGGNAAFSKDATLVAHDNVRKRLASAGVMGNGGSMANPAEAQPKEALPVVTFGHDLTLHLNGEEIRAIHLPHGHTDGDAIVWFVKSKVVHTGDVFVTYGFPFIDLSGGGSSAGMIAGLEKAIAQLPVDVKVIPGHGPVSSVADVRKYVAMLKETRAAVQAGIRAGKTLKQLQDEKVLARWQSYSGDFITTELFVETLFNELTGKAGGGVVRHN
jgi:glyoxylase-like metal-dependent hydrolase (beta-lactamase superfamily II)